MTPSANRSGAGAWTFIPVVKQGGVKEVSRSKIMNDQPKHIQGHQAPRQEGSVSVEHAYPLTLLYPETREPYEAFNEQEETIDPEHARKVAAIRTELMQRWMDQAKERK